MKKTEDKRERWFTPGIIKTSGDLLVWHRKYIVRNNIARRLNVRRMKKLIDMVVERDAIIKEWKKAYTVLENHTRAADIAVNFMTEKLVQLGHEDVVKIIIGVMKKIRGEE